jgi:hypothetical protein
MEICMNVGDLANPKWFCEGFDFNGGFISEKIDEDMIFNNPDRDKINPGIPIYDTDKYKGLCINCENRETCNLQVPESGVWHCEEYE